MKKGGYGITSLPKMREVPGCPRMRSRGFGQRDRGNDSWAFSLASVLPMMDQFTLQ